MSKPGTRQGSVDGFARDVIPIGPAFVVDEQNQSVIEPTRTKVVNLSVNGRRQTDATVADTSERDQIRRTNKFALGNVMIDHLARQQCSTFALPLE